MMHDRQITLTVGNNRKSMNWQPQVLMLSEFYARPEKPGRSTETMAEYLKLTKSVQENLKDIGGFVAGTLSGTRRKADAVIGCDLITLDFDNIPPRGTDEVLTRIDALNFGYCVCSTRKHTSTTPRLRILLPFDRTATADEYEPVARYMASLIGIEYANPTTFEAHRLMYWSSCCADGKFVFKVGDKPMLRVDELLAELDKDMAIGAINGVVGAFCRTYDIYGAKEKFLPDV